MTVRAKLSVVSIYCVSGLCLEFLNIIEYIIQHEYPSNRNHPTISRITEGDKDIPAASDLGNVFIFIIYFSSVDCWGDNQTDGFILALTRPDSSA